MTIGLVLFLAGAAQAGEAGWVPPPPIPPTPPLAGQEEVPTMAGRRIGGAINLLWTKGIQTAYLSMLLTHVIVEAAGQDASRLVFPETPLMGGHAAAFTAGPWGYALLLDDGRPHRRHLGLAIGLFEQSAYSATVAVLNILTRTLYIDQNGCHIDDPRGCIDNFYKPTSISQGVIMMTAAPILFACGMLHAVAAARLKKLEAAGVMDGPEGEPYRAIYRLPSKPEVMIMPAPGGVAIVGRF